MLPGEIREVGRASKTSSWLPVARHSSTEFDEALNGRLFSEIGASPSTDCLLLFTTLKPVSEPSRSMMAVFLSPSLNWLAA